MKNCPIAEICPKYTNGTKRKPHHMRLTVPCSKFMDCSCQMATDLQFWLEGEGISCNLAKIRKLKGGIL